MGNTSVIGDIAIRGSFERFLIMEDAILERFDLLCELVVLVGGVSLLIGDGGKKSVCNGVKEFSVDVRVGGEH